MTTRNHFFCALLWAAASLAAVAQEATTVIGSVTTQDDDWSKNVYDIGTLPNRELAPSKWESITYDDFEDRTWGNYRTRDGNIPKSLKQFTYNFQTLYSARIRGGKAPPDSSFDHARFIDVSAYEDLKLHFYYLTRGMKNVEHSFMIEYRTSSSGWKVAEKIDRFSNGVAIEKTIRFSDKSINASNLQDVKIRFHCKAPSTKSVIFVDNIQFEGQQPLVPYPPPTKSPTRAPSTSPSFALSTDEICPLDRLYPPTKYEIFPYYPDVPTTGVKDNLEEISSLVFTDQTDAQGNLYAYTASDKNQFSIKVIRFERYPITGQVIMGSGTTVATYSLAVHYSNSDWEDMSLGPCDGGSNAPSCIYVGNFGNNNRGGGYVQRDVLKIFKFPEPDFNGSTPVDMANVPVTSILYKYGTGFDPSLKFDAEAMFVDWVGTGKGDIYIITKGGCTLGGVGVIPASYHASLGSSSYDISTTEDIPAGVPVYSMAAVMTKPPKQGDTHDCSSGAFRSWLGADMRRDGRLIALIAGVSPPRVYFYPRVYGQSVVEALNSSQSNATANCPYIASTSYGLDDEKKHEAVAFLPDGQSFADTSECSGGRCKDNVPIYFWDLVYPGSPDPTSRNGLIPGDSWITFTHDDFESGDHSGSYILGIETSATSDVGCRNLPSDNNWSVMLSLHNGVDSSIFHSAEHDATGFEWLRVSFDFLTNGYDHMDSMFLELSIDGSDEYFIVADWALDVHGFTHQCQWYNDTVVFHARDFERDSFGQVRLRFRSSANARNDRIYVDNVLFEGHE